MDKKRKTKNMKQPYEEAKKKKNENFEVGK